MGSVPQGIHNAICIGIVNIGTQRGQFGPQKKVTLLWEIHINNQIKNASREYTLSFDERATLRKHLERWRGRPFTKDELSRFQLRNILGVPCRLEIGKDNGQKYVKNIYPFPKDEEKPISETEHIYFDIANEKTYQALKYVPTYLLTRIKQTPEYKQSRLNGKGNSDIYID